MILTCWCYLAGCPTSASCVEARVQRFRWVAMAGRERERCPEGVVVAAGPAAAPDFIAIFAPSGHLYAFVHSFTQPAHVIFCAILWIFKSRDFSRISHSVLNPCFVFSITAIFVFLLIIIRFFIVSTSAVVLSIVQMLCFHAFSRTAFLLRIFVFSVLAL